MPALREHLESCHMLLRNACGVGIPFELFSAFYALAQHLDAARPLVRRVSRNGFGIYHKAAFSTTCSMKYQLDAILLSMGGRCMLMLLLECFRVV